MLGFPKMAIIFQAKMLVGNYLFTKELNSARPSLDIDVDAAAESTKLVRYNILQQPGIAMLAQAKQSSQSILRSIS